MDGAAALPLRQSSKELPPFLPWHSNMDVKCVDRGFMNKSRLPEHKDNSQYQ